MRTSLIRFPVLIRLFIKWSLLCAALLLPCACAQKEETAVKPHQGIPAGLSELDSLVAVMKTSKITEPDFLIENSCVNKFINSVKYTDGDYSYTCIPDYYTPSKDGDVSYPAEKTVSWTLGQDPVIQELILADETDGTVTVKYLDNSSRSEQMRNFIPNHKYRYGIAVKAEGAGRFRLIKAASFKTTGQVRMLNVESGVSGKYVNNVRDIGGWKGIGGKRIRYGKLFRGSTLCNKDTGESYVDSVGIKTLRDAGVKAEMDLQTSVAKQESVLGPDIKFDWIGTGYCMEIAFIKDSRAYASMMENVIGNLSKGLPTYVHCTGGADRTGTLFYLILGLCGLSESDLAKEYELTCFSKNKRYRCNIDGYDSINDPEHKAEPKIELHFVNMIQYFNKYNGATLSERIENLVKTELGISDAGIAMLRTCLLEE